MRTFASDYPLTPKDRRHDAPEPFARRRDYSRTLDRFFAALLQRAGIEIGGPNPWDPVVHDPRLFARVARDGTLGLGEAYVDGWWDCERLDGFFARVLRAGLDGAVHNPSAAESAVANRALAARCPRRISVGSVSASAMLRPFAVPLLVGAVFGLLAGACAFLIAYGEYQRHFPDKRTPVRMALQTALPAFLFFFLAAFLPWLFLGSLTQ